MAKNKSINVILNLKDKFTQPIQRTASEAKKFERQVKRVENNITKSTKKVATDFSNMAKNITKSVASISFKGLTAISGASIAGVTAGLTAGIMEGMDYETYKVQLETATKDTEKAAKLMADAVQFANKTPFETGQVIEATSKFEAMGLSAEKWLSITADMAGATSKDMIQAVEAVIDAVASGEFERLKEFGIKKDSLDGFDNKGSLADQDAMVASLMAQMEDRFKGGAESLSKTTKGLWSTVTGVAKNSMAKVVGVMDDGTVRSGSLLERFKGVIEKVANQFVAWQQSGTFDRIGKLLDTMIRKAVTGFKLFIGKVKEVKDKISELYARFKSGEFDHFIDLLKNTAGILVAVFVAQKLWTAGVKIHELWLKRQAIVQGTVNAVTKAWNLLAIANPWGLLLTGVIALLVLVALNFDWVKDKCSKLWELMKAWWTQSIEQAKQSLENLKQGIKSAWDWICNATSSTVEWIGSGFSNLWQGLKNGVKGFANFFIDKINGCINGLNQLFTFNLPEFMGGGQIGLSIPTIPNFATGTSYHRGGLARINEGGRGEIVNLPNGTQVVPNSISKNVNKNNANITVPITIQGNIYGDRDLVDRVGGMIAQRVSLAIGNV